MQPVYAESDGSAKSSSEGDGNDSNFSAGGQATGEDDEGTKTNTDEEAQAGGSKGAGSFRQYMEKTGRRRSKQDDRQKVTKRKNIKGKQRVRAVGVDSDEGEGTDDEQLMAAKKAAVAQSLGVDVEKVTEEDMVNGSSVFDREEVEPDVEHLDDLSTLKWGNVVEDEAYEFLTPPPFTGQSGPMENNRELGMSLSAYTCLVLVCFCTCTFLVRHPLMSR